MMAMQRSKLPTFCSVTSCSNIVRKKYMANTIWVLVELDEGKPVRSSLEVLGKAAKLGRAEAIVLGAVAADVAPTLGQYGAEKVYAHSSATYDNYLTLP